MSRRPDGAPRRTSARRTTGNGARAYVGSVARRSWLALAMVVVVALAAVCIWRIRSSYDSQGAIDGPGSGADVVLFHPKLVTYELFGSLGGGGTANYTNVTTTRPNQIELTGLPWSYTESTLLTSASASIMAQVDGSGLGCRISVNGVVRDEQSVDHDHAAVFCNVTSA